MLQLTLDVIIRGELIMKVGLACTGGGARAAINIGAIRALKELHIEIEAISGASIGSCVALLYVLGYSPKEMLEEFKTHIKKWGRFSMFDILLAPFRLMARGGLKNPKIINRNIEEVTKKYNVHFMKDINIPFIIPSLDITKRKSIYYSSVPMNEFTHYTDRTITEAIRSSSSIPVIFTPNRVSINHKTHYMMDGGITSNTPVLPLKQFSDFVIGIEPKYYNTQEKQKIHFLSAFTETFQAMRRSSLYFQKKEADLWIEVDVQKSKVFGSSSELEYCEKCGYDAVMKYAKQICKHDVL